MAEAGLADASMPVESTSGLDAKGWLEEIDASLKRQEKWHRRGDAVVRRYRDERDRTDRSVSRVNILWSNTEVLKGALYARSAKPDVRRRFVDAKRNNPAARTVAEIIERGLTYCADAYDVDAPIEAAVEDLLLPGRGTAWVVYDPEVQQDQVGEQRLGIEYVYWKDFAHGVARAWADVPWVARRLAMRKTAVQAKWPDAKRDLAYDFEPQGREAKKAGQTDRFAEIWEIWDKTSRRRIYVARGYMDTLQEDDDPLKLRGFFPCPKPLYAVTTTEGLIPEPEFTEYQDQANQLDTISTRIDRLLSFAKWNGIYDGSDNENAQALAGMANADDGQFLAYGNWAQLRDRGGIENAFGFNPIERIAAVVVQLAQRKADLVNEIYQITGISDIIRGSTDPRETKGAQQLKAQFGSMRIQRRQRDVQRFIRDIYRIKGEIIAEHWTREMIAAATGIELPLAAERDMARQLLQFAQQTGQPPPDPRIMQAAEAKATWEEVAEIMRSDERRAYTVDIETDSTVMVDAEAEKQSRLEFLGTFRQAVVDAVQGVQAAPFAAELVKETLLFTVRTFKAGKAMEEAVERVIDQAAQQPPPQPEPQQEEAAPDAALADVERKAKRDAAEIQIAQGDQKLRAVETAANLQKMQAQTVAAMRPKPAPNGAMA